MSHQVCAYDAAYLHVDFTRVTCLTHFAQRDDKVKLYKTLKENLEQIKAGTFNTSSMQVVHLV